MRQKSKSTPASPEGVVRDIRRATRNHHGAEEKIRIVLDGLRGETSIAELCRREGIAGARELLPAWRSRSSDRALRRALQLQALPRKLTEPHPGRRLLRQRPDHPSGTRKDQTRHHQTATIETPLERRLNSNPNEPEPPFQYSSDCPKALRRTHRGI